MDWIGLRIKFRNKECFEEVKKMKLVEEEVYVFFCWKRKWKRRYRDYDFDFEDIIEIYYNNNFFVDVI